MWVLETMRTLVMRRMHHVFLTRFNLPSEGVESLIRSRGDWLRERVDLFEKYTVPSVLSQTRPEFSWVVYLDPDSPQWLRERMRAHERSGLILKYQVPRSAADVAADIGSILEPQVDHVITSNIDNDDGLARDFVDRLHDAVGSTERTGIYFARGLIKHGPDLYVHTDRSNAFAAVAERREDMLTCWVDWHNRLGRHMPVKVVGGGPAWLQVVHERNVSNRVKGHLVSPTPYRESFGSAIDGTREPSRPRRIASRLVASPARTVRDVSRRATVTAVLRVGGKDGVERWKLRLARVKRR